MYSVFLAFTLQPQTQLPQSLQGRCSTPCGLLPSMVKLTAMVSASTAVPISCARRLSACTLASCMARGCTEGASTSRARWVALRDRAHGSEPIITPEAKAWVLALACTKPKDHGLAAELWTRSALAKHIRHSARAAGHPSVAGVAKSTIHVILRDAPVRSGGCAWPEPN